MRIVSVGCKKSIYMGAVGESSTGGTRLSFEGSSEVPEVLSGTRLVVLV